jgi:large subunit ribosomal protein L23
MIIDNVKSLVFTEKASRLVEESDKYTFDVDLRLTKPQIRQFVEKVFNVKVLSVNTHLPPHKKKRVGSSQGCKAQYKRAIVTLRKGDLLLKSLKKEDKS